MATMKFTFGLAVVLAASTAMARPLPDGLKITFAKNKVTATKDGVSVTIGSVTAVRMTKAELSDDGKDIKIKLEGTPSIENEMGEREQDDGLRQYALATVEGKLANAAGMGLSLKKKYADAIPHFTTAMQKDPLPVYITNLLSAQSLAGKLADADAVLAAHGRRIAPWIAWRLVVDPDLKALLGRPSAKLGATGTGKAKSKLFEGVAYSPLGFAAVEIVTNASMGDNSGPVDYALAFVDLKTGEQVFVLETETACALEDKACARKQAPVTAKRRAIAEKVLAMLDFQQVPDGYKTAVDEDEIASKDGRKVDIKNEMILVGGKKIPLPKDLPQIWGVAFVPKAVVLQTRDKNGDSFDIRLTAIPTP